MTDGLTNIRHSLSGATDGKVDGSTGCDLSILIGLGDNNMNGENGNRDNTGKGRHAALIADVADLYYFIV